MKSSVIALRTIPAAVYVCLCAFAPAAILTEIVNFLNNE